MKKYKNSLVLGSFEPPTKGHLYLIDTAINKSETVHLFICYRKDDIINGYIRYEYLRYLYSSNPNVIIYNIEHDFDDYPGEFGSTVEQFYNYWCNEIVYPNVKNLDVVFTSEKYGDEFSKYLGIDHYLVDIHRIKYPISGTMVRENYIKYLNMIPDVTKSYYNKKIVLVGPESSGKTTLSKLLSEKLNASLVNEYGAEYIDKLNLNKNTRNNKNFTILDISHIAAGQIYSEDTTNFNNGIIIYDTDLITTQIWSEIYFNMTPKWIIDESYRRKYDLYLLMDIDFDWIDEGIREFPDKRKWHFNRLKQELDRRKINYKIISGTVENRLKQSISIIKNL